MLTRPLSLSPQFMAQGKTGSSSPPGGPPKPGSQLDSMLGSLQSDLNKLGVATVAKGVCGACKKPIAGQVMRRGGAGRGAREAGCRGAGPGARGAGPVPNRIPTPRVRW